ncbi:MAG TPA: hypothetical protein VGB87_19495 [Vicinamibacteria bacterium]
MTRSSLHSAPWVCVRVAVRLGAGRGGGALPLLRAVGHDEAGPLPPRAGVRP